MKPQAARFRWWAVQTASSARDQLVHHRVRMERRRREAQPLGAARNGREVDRLDVDARARVSSASETALAERRIAHQHGHDMARRMHDRQARIAQQPLQPRCALLELRAARRRFPSDAGCWPARRPQSPAASDVVKMKPGAKERMQSTISRAGGDVAAHDAESLGERALDDVDAMHGAVARRDARAARAVKAHAVDFVEIGQAPYFSARSQICGIGPKSPSME